MKQIEIIFENENVIVVNKPAGILSVPARDLKDDRFVLGKWLESHCGCQIFPTHRLDFEVSGLILYAKNANAHQSINQWFENRLIHKTYQAVTTGPDFSHFPAHVSIDKSAEHLSEGQKMIWKSKILKGKKRTFESPQGKYSETEACVISIQNSKVIWQLNPVTGRSHQLRWELSRHGYPIDGDKLYGSKLNLENTNEILLKSFRLDLSQCPSSIRKKLSLPALWELKN